MSERMRDGTGKREKKNKEKRGKNAVIKRNWDSENKYRRKEE